jgi:hypothetical protein
MDSSGQSVRNIATARGDNLIKEKNNGIEEESDRKAPEGQDNTAEEAALQSNRRLQIRGAI